MEKSELSLKKEVSYNELPFQLGFKGMRFRKKKHNELKQIAAEQSNNNETIKHDITVSKPQLSSKQYRPIANNNSNNSKKNNVDKIYENKESIKNKIQKKNENNILQNNTLYDSTNSLAKRTSKHNEPKFKYEIIIKNILEENEKQLIQYENKYNKMYSTRLFNLIAQQCKKKLTKTEIVKLKPKISFNLQLENSFTIETSSINIYLVVMNLLFNIGSQIITKITNSKKKTKPKLPELLLFYWINNLIIKTNSILLGKANLVLNENEKNKINTKNIQNILNQQKEDLLHQIYEILSNYKKKFLIEKQFNYFINNYFNNAMYDILKTQKISTLKQLYVINLNENISVNSFIFNNKLFLSNQGDFSNKHRQVNKKLEEIKFKLKEKKIEMYIISKLKNIMNNNLSSKIVNLNVYYLSTSTLIDDFLSCDDTI
jgi:hypothetical protein